MEIIFLKVTFDYPKGIREIFYIKITAQLAGKVRKKGLELAEKILDNAGSPPYTQGQLDIALKAIELYNAFK